MKDILLKLMFMTFKNYMILPFLSEIMKIGKVKKFLFNLHDKTECVVIHISNLKEALSHGLFLEKVHRVIKFNQKAWLKPCIDMNTDLRKKGKNGFEDFFKLINNALFGKTMENVRKHRDIKLVTTERRRNYYNVRFFTKSLLDIQMKKTEILMNKPVYLGLPILELCKILIYEFW